MELIFILIAIVYSVWSEVNKKKEEDIDINFSELSSLDEFFKKDQKNAPAKRKVSYSPSASKTSKESRGQKKSRKAVNYDDLPALTGQVNHTRVDENSSKPRVNYDKLPALTGQVNYTRVSDENAEQELMNQNQAATVARNLQSSTRTGVGFSFDRNDVVKAFVLNEVMQRYDINRIYSRIPGFPKEE